MKHLKKFNEELVTRFPLLKGEIMIKKWIEFISESLAEEIDDKKFWKLDENDIRDYLLDLTDEGHSVIVNFGFLEESEDYKGEKTISYTEIVKPDKNIRPAYWIDIYNSRRSKEDLTDSLLFAWDNIKEKVGGEIYLHDQDGTIDINDIIVKDGEFFIEKGELLTEGHISFFAIQKEPLEFTQKQVADYYGWEYDKVSESGTIFTHIDLEEMTDQLLDRNSNYKEFLIKGIEAMWDHYESHYYIPDIQSLFQYELSKENEVLLLKAMIKEVGELEDFINHIGDECDDNVYNDVKDMKEDELINYLLKERFYNTIEQLSSNSDIYSEITQTVADWLMSAHVDTNHDEIVHEFDRIVEKEFEFNKIRKEVKNSYTTKDSEGNNKVVEYTEEVDFYEISFDSKWMEGYDSNDLFGVENIYDMFREYCGKEYFRHEMNPSISDYGSVDSKELNSEISAILNNFLKRNQ